MLSRRLALILLAVIGTASDPRAGAQQTPTFRAGVDLVAVDVQVVTGNGAPITGLGADRFEVSINGRRRRVVSAELVRYDAVSSASSTGLQPAVQRAPAGGIAPGQSPEGRVYIIAIDLLSFRPGATRWITSAAREFIEKLQPTDLVGLAAFPAGPEIDASTDRASVINALGKVVGAGDPVVTAANRFGLNPHNIVDITAAAQIEPYVDLTTAPPNSTIRRVGMAVCAYDRDPEDCARWVVSDAQSLAVYEEGLAIQRLGALRALLSALTRAPGRKTLVFLSTGFPATDVPGGRPNIGELGLLVGQEAARANTTIYSLHVDSRRMEIASAEGGRTPRPTDNQSRDSAILSRPLDQVSGLSGGALFTVAQGGGESAFDRVRSETSSLYMLGVEPDDSDRTGSPRQLRVRVNSGQRGAIVRARTWVVVPRPGSAASPLNAGRAASAPKVATATPTAEDIGAYERLWKGSDPNARPAGAAVGTVVTPEPPPAPRTAVDELFAAYSSGDRDVLMRELGSPAGFERVRPDLGSTLARWRREWSPERAAFALEIALTAFARGWPNSPAYLNAARDIVVARPDAPGAEPDQDTFELRFHRAAVAILAALDGPTAVDAYLASIQHRVALGDTVPASAVLSDARLLLARAAAREVQTLMLLASVGSRRDDPWVWPVSKGDEKVRGQLEEVDALLDRASTDDDTRPETSVRRAFIQYRLGQHQNALVLLTAVAPADAIVDYWRALIQGRVLVALGREQEAIKSFERASVLAPDAQTPAVALSTIFLKRGDRKQALGWAERARTTAEDGVDPWPLYWRGAARFLVPWVTELRDNSR